MNSTIKILFLILAGLIVHQHAYSLDARLFEHITHKNSYDVGDRPFVWPSGRIVYEHSYHVSEVENKSSPYSSSLTLANAKYYSAKTTIIYFDGRRSRREETKYEYGCFESKTTRISLQRDDSSGYYCQNLPYLNYYYPYIRQVFPIYDYREGPRIKYLEETKTIAGYDCKKALVETSYESYYIFYTDSLYIYDPTDAVLKVRGFRKLIMEWEEIPKEKYSKGVYKITTVKEIILEPLSDTIFEPPTGFVRFDTLQKARDYNRAQMLKESEIEWIHKPLKKNEPNMFVGSWLMSLPEDTLLIQVVYAGDEEMWTNQFKFRQYILTNKSGYDNAYAEGEATLSKRLLIVEYPPYYRIFRYDKKLDAIVNASNEIYTFKKINENSAIKLKNKK